MPPRGLKKVLKDSQPCKLVGSGDRKRFEVTIQGQRGGLKLRGVTKRLENCLFSSGTLPAIARASDAPAGGHWRGPGGGRRRGSAVDAQVSRLAGLSAEKRIGSKMLNLTRNVFAALSARGLEPVLGQRAVCSERHRIGTAADIVCHDAAKNELVVCELKCGHSGARTAAAIKNGRSCNMQKSLSKAPDNTVNRHLAQLAVTHHLLTKEKKTLTKLGVLGIDSVSGLLIYANDSGVEAYKLQDWWIAKASSILDDMR